MNEINMPHRVYHLSRKDIFSVDVESFCQTSVLWSHDFQILGFDKYKRKHWWKFWKPRFNTFARLMYLGGDKNNEQN